VRIGLEAADGKNPVLLGDGIRLFGNPRGRPIHLQQPDAEDPIAAVAVRYPVTSG